jgi:hypothetical protein
MRVLLLLVVVIGACGATTSIPKPIPKRTVAEELLGLGEPVLLAITRQGLVAVDTNGAIFRLLLAGDFAKGLVDSDLDLVLLGTEGEGKGKIVAVDLRRERLQPITLVTGVEAGMDWSVTFPDGHRVTLNDQAINGSIDLAEGRSEVWTSRTPEFVGAEWLKAHGPWHQRPVKPRKIEDHVMPWSPSSTAWLKPGRKDGVWRICSSAGCEQTGTLRRIVGLYE